MKKLISFILASTMVLSLSFPAFAAEAESQNKSVTANKQNNYKASIDVSGTYLEQLKSDEIISAVVAWEDMNFIYYGSQEGTWNPSKHTYGGDKDAKWNKTTSNITVTNHSNVAVVANLSYKSTVSTVTGALSESSLSLESAAQEQYMGNNAGNAPTATSTFKIDETSTMNADSGADLGTITVSLVGGADLEEDEDANIEWTMVSTFDDLNTAIQNGENVKLSEDISTTTHGNQGRLLSTKNFKLNLNGKKLRVESIHVQSNGLTSISNGTIETYNGTVGSVSGELIIKNCTVTASDFYALVLLGTTATVKNTILNGGVKVVTYSTTATGSTLTATKNVTINLDSPTEYNDFYVNAGSTATVGFDPTSILSSDVEATVTDNGNGTWTVTGK